MNKKAVYMETFNVLIAVAVIATAFFLFYTYYGVAAKGLGGKITEKTADFRDNLVLINLLNTPVDEKTIADLIATSDPMARAEVMRAIETVFGKSARYEFLVGDTEFVGSGDEPDEPVVKEVLLPTPDTIKKITLRIET